MFPNFKIISIDSRVNLCGGGKNRPWNSCCVGVSSAFYYSEWTNNETTTFQKQQKQQNKHTKLWLKRNTQKGSPTHDRTTLHIHFWLKIKKVHLIPNRKWYCVECQPHTEQLATINLELFFFISSKWSFNHTLSRDLASSYSRFVLRTF